MLTACSTAQMGRGGCGAFGKGRSGVAGIMVDVWMVRSAAGGRSGDAQGWDHVGTAAEASTDFVRLASAWREMKSGVPCGKTGRWGAH